MATVTGRVVRVIRHGHTVWGNPMLSVELDTSTDTGVFGIEHDPDGKLQCRECGHTWSNDITPSGRCPWEYEHGTYEVYRLSNDSGLAYAIGNPEFKARPHTFVLTRAGRISHEGRRQRGVL